MNETATVEQEIVIEAQEAQETIKTPVENPEYEYLLDAVQEIRKNPDVVGYILKSESKATVDLNDPAKIIEYAMLSSQAFETADTLASTFSVGETENILIEGKDLKVLCLSLGSNKISIFMEKGTDHTDILKVLAPQPE
jgi:predicted regulator of Ras-like GTPase activity (Roadblock/LC7/MglB family)